MTLADVRRDGALWCVGLDRPEKRKLSLRLHRRATTTFDVAAHALLSESEDKHDRLIRFAEGRR